MVGFVLLWTQLVECQQWIIWQNSTFNSIFQNAKVTKRQDKASLSYLL